MTCPAMGSMVDCLKVNTSVYSRLMGIPIALLGVFYYSYIFLSTIYLFFSKYRNKIIKFNFAVSTFGVLFSVYLVYVQLGILHAICPYCMLSAFFNNFDFWIGCGFVF